MWLSGPAVLSRSAFWPIPYLWGRESVALTSFSKNRTVNVSGVQVRQSQGERKGREESSGLARAVSVRKFSPHCFFTA